MFLVAAAFPLTSDQPPVAVADPASVMPPAQTQGGRAAPGEARQTAPAAAQPAGETPDPWKLDPARDPRALVGPRPAFEANILDAERNLQVRLARLELARSHDELLRSLTPAPSREAGNRPSGLGAGEQPDRVALDRNGAAPDEASSPPAE